MKIKKIPPFSLHGSKIINNNLELNNKCVLIIIVINFWWLFFQVMHTEKARLYLKQKQNDPTQRGTYNATSNDTLMKNPNEDATHPGQQYGRRLQGLFTFIKGNS